jgi:hypothetical protein
MLISVLIPVGASSPWGSGPYSYSTKAPPQTQAKGEESDKPDLVVVQMDCSTNTELYQ